MVPSSPTTSQRMSYAYWALTNASTSASTPSSVWKITSCGSRTPSAAWLVGRGVSTVARTISWPSSQRIVSISCTTVSVTIISEPKPGGTLGLRCAQWTSTGRPISPASSFVFMSA